ncbi:MAG: major outer membrane protein, partial [Campylobacteraceae bacterium]|nr:major outer membrane protein [Campylobacteraceae bacterium]
MRLVKLSLVAAMAAGVMATTASAVPLEEAIKDVDVTGFTRLRYTHDEGDGNVNTTTRGQWNFKGVLDIKTKIDDNFFAVVGIRYNESDTSTTTSTSTGGRSGGNDFDLYRAYFGYNIGGTTVTVGRQAVGAFFTDDM